MNEKEFWFNYHDPLFRDMFWLFKERGKIKRIFLDIVIFTAMIVGCIYSFFRDK